MGICFNRMSWDTSLHSSSSSSPCNVAIHSSVSASHCKDLLFTPILPFSTQSNLGAVYLLGSEIGQGQSGIIRHCSSHSSGAIFACKSISKLRLCTAQDVEDVIREVRIMKHLSNPIPSHTSPNGTTTRTSLHSCLHGSLVCLHDVIEDKAFVHLIMELCRGGELFDRIMRKKCYPEPQAAFIIKSLVETVQYCHSMGIMHRDIKPENILLVEDSDTSAIRLADFGLALEFSPGQKFSGMAGSTYYIAPEVLQGEYSEEVDMWSVGVIMYVLLSGVPPFWGATEQRIFKAIQKGDLSFPPNPWNKISSSAKDLITQMLHPNVKLRSTPPKALKHPWILLHTKAFEHVQSNSTSTTLSIPKNSGKLGSHTSTFAPTHSRTLLRTGMSNVAKPELSKFLVDIVSSMNRNTHFVSDSLPGQKLQNGWTCSVVSLDGNEETLLVDMGKEKYLVSHDRTIKKIGWKLIS